MTPTLALVVERETAIDSFKKEKFYTVELDCGFSAVSDRMAEKKAAEKLKAACAGQPATIRSVEKKQRTASPPKLYDLTSLQRDGNRLFGYTAQQVLDYAQALYEKKLLTYPRTDSNYLTEDTAATVPELFGAICFQPAVFRGGRDNGCVPCGGRFKGQRPPRAAAYHAGKAGCTCCAARRGAQHPYPGDGSASVRGQRKAGL